MLVWSRATGDKPACLLVGIATAKALNATAARTKKRIFV